MSAESKRYHSRYEMRVLHQLASPFYSGHYVPDSRSMDWKPGAGTCLSLLCLTTCGTARMVRLRSISPGPAFTLEDMLICGSAIESSVTAGRTRHSKLENAQSSSISSRHGAKISDMQHAAQEHGPNQQYFPE